jgi:hypothetical protein
MTWQDMCHGYEILPQGHKVINYQLVSLKKKRGGRNKDHREGFFFATAKRLEVALLRHY